MRKPKIIPKIILGFFLALVSLKPCFAVDDGFASTEKIESKYFTIYYSPGLKLAKPDEQSNYTRQGQVLVSAEQPASASDSFSEMLDNLFSHVSDLLDMRLNSFHAEIKVCKDSDCLNNIYKQLFTGNLDNQPAFYTKNLNTIYVSAKSCSRETIGRQIAYAILSQYFQVQTPGRVQDVLASYVESQLRNNQQ